LKIVRSKLALESNRLGHVSKWLGIDGKDHINNDDWLNVLKGDEKTLRKIGKYNRHDVINGKSVLMKFLPLANKRNNYGALKADPKALIDYIQEIKEIVEDIDK
jgi:uncharacterized protein YprB with RNaseH-like and TPR domain